MVMILLEVSIVRYSECIR